MADPLSARSTDDGLVTARGFQLSDICNTVGEFSCITIAPHENQN
jgi:hypothetical protein